MSNKLLLTKYNGLVLTARKEGNDIVEMNFEPESAGTIVGNIYVGRVENVVKNINAAFVSYDKGKVAYLPLEETLILNRNIHQGELVLIQITSEAIKTKPPKATTYINFTGRYSVITIGKPGLGISAKISGADIRARYKKILNDYLSDEYGVILRTNAETVNIDEVLDEVKALIKEYEYISGIAETRSAHTLLRAEEKSYIKELRSVNFDEISQIVTDDRAIYDEVLAYIEKYNQKISMEKLIFMDKEDYSVLKLHSLESTIKQALSEKVWLKCGGYLVIQPTEALTVIDVNSGKCILKKKTVAETIKKVNLEACKMIAKQLRLRNLSGIIIVDFIDMEEEADRKELLKFLKECVEEDPVKTVVVDITKLNLVEITRKKIRKPISEQLASFS